MHTFTFIVRAGNTREKFHENIAFLNFANHRDQCLEIFRPTDALLELFDNPYILRSLRRSVVHSSRNLPL